MKTTKKLISLLCIAVLAGLMAFTLAGCGPTETAKDFSKYTFAQFDAETWDSKEISYQFIPTEESAKSWYAYMAFPSAMNLFKDGSVAVWNGDISGILIHYTEEGLGSIGYGWWSQEGDTLTIDYDLWLTPGYPKNEGDIPQWTKRNHYTETVTIPSSGSFGVSTYFTTHLPGYEEVTYKIYCDKTVNDLYRTKSGVGSIKKTS